MATLKPRLRSIGVALAVTALIVPAAAQAQDEEVTLTFMNGVVEQTIITTEALAAAYTEMHPNVTFEFETLPSGPDGENLLRTRLATGEAADIIWFNSGSLLQSMNPSETMLEITDEPFMDNVVESFIPTVSVGDAVYGVPGQTAIGGGILYNKKVYEDLELEIPTTWEELAANNEIIKAAGIAPMGATFAAEAIWTSQFLVLADNCNVLAAEPDFAERYTANEAHYSDTPAAMAGFEHLQEAYDKGWWQEDFGATTYEQGVAQLANGEIAHYPMFTLAMGQVAIEAPDHVEDVGFFGMPGTESACATLWMPSAIYVSKTTEHPDIAKDFLAFVASVEGTETITAAYPPSGPYLVKGATLPDDVVTAVKEVQTYIDSGASAPALEFVSPVKGPSLPNLTVAVGSGINTAAEGAELYDQDVEKAAQQLGLPGW